MEFYSILKATLSPAERLQQLEDLLDALARDRPGLPVLLFLHSSDCGSCHEMLPLIRKYATQHEDQVSLVTCSLDWSPVIAQKYGVKRIPALLWLRQKRPVRIWIGATTDFQKVRDHFDPELNS